MTDELYDPQTKLSLEHMTPNMPPGWKPNVKRYPFRQYHEKLEEWNSMRDPNMQWHKVGALIGSRLKGTASQFIKSLAFNGVSYPRFLKVEADASGTIDTTEEKVRVKFLCDSVAAKYSAEEEDFQYATLDNFFRLSQGNSSFEDYVTNHELALADATEQCGLQMNSIGQSYFLLEGSNLTDKQRFDIRMRCDGKLADTAKIKNLMIRMCGSSQEAQSSTRLRMSANSYYDSSESWQSDYWNSSS